MRDAVVSRAQKKIDCDTFQTFTCRRFKLPINWKQSRPRARREWRRGGAPRHGVQDTQARSRGPAPQGAQARYGLPLSSLARLYRPGGPWEEDAQVLPFHLLAAAEHARPFCTTLRTIVDWHVAQQCASRRCVAGCDPRLSRTAAMATPTARACEPAPSLGPGAPL